MQLMDYVLSPLAENDLIEIWCHIAKDNQEAADTIIHKIMDTFQLLTKVPLAGRAREEILTDIRSFGAYPYIIFYKVTSSEIQVIRVLHGARDSEAFFH